MAEAMAVDSPVSRSPESMIEAIDNCDEGTLRRLLQTVIRKVPDCRRKIAQDYGLAAELYQVSEEDRQKAIADQYSEVKTGMKDDSSSSDHLDFCERAKFVPMRLTYDERKYLRLIDATMHVSHYTDHMDTAASVNANNARKLASVPQSNHQAQDGIHSPPDRRWDALSSSCCRDEQHGPTVSRRSRIEGQKRHVNIVHMFLCTNVVTGSLKHPSQSGAFPRNGWSAAIKPHMNQDGASSESEDAVECEEDIYLDNAG
eukprot:s402_g7.t1